MRVCADTYVEPPDSQVTPAFCSHFLQEPFQDEVELQTGIHKGDFKLLVLLLNKVVLGTVWSKRDKGARIFQKLSFRIFDTFV